MPKNNKYYYNSTFLKSLDIVSKQAKENLDPRYYDYLKEIMAGNKKLIDNKAKLRKENLSDADKAKLNAKIKEIENGLRETEFNYVDVATIDNKSFYQLTGVKQAVKKVSGMGSMKSMAFKQFKTYFNFAAENIFSKDFELNDKETTQAVKNLFEKMAKKDAAKMEMGEKAVDKGYATSFIEAMEFETFGQKPTAQNCADIIKDFYALGERVLAADDNMHVNSSEYKAMVKSFKGVYKALHGNVINPVEVGDKLDALKKASVKYINAKGYNGQYTDLGKERMKLALDIANAAFDHGEIFKSLDTIKRAEITSTNMSFAFTDKENRMEARMAQRFEKAEKVITEKTVALDENAVNEVAATKKEAANSKKAYNEIIELGVQELSLEDDEPEK